MLRIDDGDRVRLLTLDRPDARNAFDTALYLACAEALTDAAHDPGLGAVVITGAGPVFSAGQDLAEMGAIDPTDEHAEHGFPRFLDALSTFPKPLVAAVNGAAVGIGMTMLPFCDLVYLADTARLRVPFVRLAVAPEAASSVTLPAAMGNQAAAHVLFTGDWIDAADAARWGLAWKVCEPAAVVDEALATARRIAAGPIPSLVEIKRLLIAGRHDAVAAARAREDDAFRRLLGGPAFNEAVAAFFEGREPDFTRLPPA